MALHESENLKVETDTENSVKKIDVDPKRFNIYALAVIVRGQIHNDQLIDITILNLQKQEGKDTQGITCISRESFDVVKKLPKKERRQVIKGIAKMMHLADKVTIRAST